MSLPEVLQWIKFGQKTGTLIFERKGIVKKVFVENGLIVSASSNDPKEYLGQVMLCFGWADENILQEAFRLQTTTKRLLGRILIENYGINEQQILKALRIKIEETVYDLFLWEDGKFIYADGVLQLQQHDRLATAITIDQVIFEGARRSDEWKEFRRSFPTDDVIFQQKGGKRDIGPLSKDFITLKIYDCVDSTKSVRRILLETRAPEYRGFEALAKLFFGDFIEATKKSIAQPEKPLDDSPSLLMQAMDHFKSKNLDKSYGLIEEYIQTHPSDSEGQTLYGVVKDAYLRELYKLCPPEAIPELSLDISDLNEKIFNSREGFLASRVNGQWDVKSLMMLSPLGELESLKILKRLVDEGVVRWKEKDEANAKK